MLGRESTDRYLCTCLVEMLREQPIESITVTDLVRHAKVSRTTFYRYFESVYDVLLMVEDEFLEGITYFVAENAAPDLSVSDKVAKDDYVAPGVRFFRENMELAKILGGRSGDAAFRMRLLACVREKSYEAMRASDRVYTENEMSLLADFAAGGILATYDWWVGKSPEVDEDEMSDLVLLVWRNVLAICGFDSFGHRRELERLRTSAEE